MDIGILIPLAFAVLIFIFALVYANVGSGGGPAYIAVMAIAGFSHVAIRPAALLLSATLSFITTIRYYRVSGFSWGTLWPLAAGSIPTAFLASGIVLSPFAYKSLAGTVLLCSALGWIIRKRKSLRHKSTVMPIWLGLVCGAVIGLLSGLVGIGGGTFLLPILVFGGWTIGHDFRATVSAFVFLTSIAALAANQPLEAAALPQMIFWVPAVLVGAWFGTEFNLEKYTTFHLTRILSLILALGALKLFIAY